MTAVPSSTPRRPPISAAVICYNEAHNIGRCLQSLNWCDEIIVVDSGSTDGTLDLVRRVSKAKVLVRPFDDYITQKNYALDQCKHEWALALDADEALTPELTEEILSLSFDAAGYFISRRTFLGDQEVKHGSWNPDYKLRLFRRSSGRWGGLNPHDKIILQGQTEYLKSRMLHFSYHDRQQFLERNRRYILLMVESMFQQGRRANPFDPYLHWFGNFLKGYVLRAGFLDGTTGLFLAYHIANGSFQKYRLLAKRCRETNTGQSKIVQADFENLKGSREKHASLRNDAGKRNVA